MQIDFGGGSEISFERKGKAGLVKLTRTEALNALTHKMILALDRALQSWEDDPEVACVILEGEGRAFCAGGDVVAAYKSGQAGTPAYEFFRDEYRLNARIGRFPKPYISPDQRHRHGRRRGHLRSWFASHRDGKHHVCHAGNRHWLLPRCRGVAHFSRICMIISGIIWRSPATASAGATACRAGSQPMRSPQAICMTCAKTSSLPPTSTRR